MTSARPVATVAAVLVASLLVGPTAIVNATQTKVGSHRMTVTGYAVDSTSPSTVNGQSAAITTLGVDGVSVTPHGNDVGTPSGAARRLLAVAHADRLQAVVLVDNSTNTGFSTALATRLLSSATRRARVAAKLVGLVRMERWDGITVDLEALAPSDAAGLVAFVARLRALLPRRDQLAVDVSAAASLGDYAQNGYRLASLSRVASVVLMAYDENGPWSGPGPIGGLPWQRASVAAARRLVPATRLVLGVATYGYTWPPESRVHDGVTVTDAEARDLAADSGRSPRWVSSQGEWTVHLRDGTVLWWSDVRSYELRRRMAARDGLAGLAIWQLSSADALPRN